MTKKYLNEVVKVNWWKLIPIIIGLAFGFILIAIYFFT